MSAAPAGGGAASSPARPPMWLRALIVIMVVMALLQPGYFLSAGNIAERGEEFLLRRHRHPRHHARDHHRRHRSLRRLDDVLLAAITCAIVMQNCRAGTRAAGRHCRSADVQSDLILRSRLRGSASRCWSGSSTVFCIAVLGLSPFVTTLGMLSIVRGLAYVVSNGRGSLPGGPGRRLFLRAHRRAICSACRRRSSTCVVLACIMAVVLHHTRFGRHVFALGGNEKAAALTGIPVDAGEDRGLCALRACRQGSQGIIISGWLGSAPGQHGDRPMSSTSSRRRSSAAPTSPAASAVRSGAIVGACCSR